MKQFSKFILGILVVFSFLVFSFQDTYAHCDGLDGPVVKAAKKALETGNVNMVLIWVQKEDENTIKDAFSKTLRVRALNQEARDLADSYFFETLVRIHRAGEGEPYTGLKPAGRDLGPVIPAADKSIEEGSIAKLKTVFEKRKLSTAKVENLFNKVIQSKDYNTDDVEAGRKYVHSYVEFLHTAEHLYAENNQTQHNHKD